MKWYEVPSEHNDIVLSSRIRLARNLVDFPFETRMTNEQRSQLNDKVKQALTHINLGENKIDIIELNTLGQVGRLALVEQHTVSRKLIEQPENRMVGLSQDGSISIMVNEEDHLRLQVLSNGLSLENAYDMCNKIDDVLDESLHYAFDEQLGYLTGCPTNLGTGMRASVMMHLPALEKSGLISRLSNTISKLGLTIRGTYGEGSKVVGSIYQISNQITLGITEQDSIQNLKTMVLQIIESEKQARENERKQDSSLLEDTVFRSLGALRYARLISDHEYFEFSSNVRLGVSLGLIKEVDLLALNKLAQTVGTATICTQAGKELSMKECNQLRSELIRKQLTT